MIPIFTAADSRNSDQHLIKKRQIPGLLLMEQAAEAVCSLLMQHFPLPCTVLCVAGKGNNGGDALAVARILQQTGYTVRVGAVSLSLPPDSQSNASYFACSGQLSCLQTPEDIHAFFAQPAQVIVDGLLGVGVNRPVQGLYAEIISAINAHSARVISIDLPSGVETDSGAADIAVQANHTVTFTAPKPGHLLFPGRKLTGTLHICPIAPPAAMQTFITESKRFWVDRFSLPKRSANTHKGDYGRFGIVAGSKGMSGAAVLCAKAALAGGAGLTTLLGCSYTADVLQYTLPPVMAKDISAAAEYLCCDAAPDAFGAFTAYAVGPGLGTRPETYPFICKLAGSDTAKVLDADALNLLAAQPTAYGSNTVLTPHPAEFSRLSGVALSDILLSPERHAMAYAQKHGVVVLLKGATTIVTDGTESYYVTAGSPGMAKGGSGDVLCGVVGALLAQGFSPLQSAYGAAYLCGKAGELAAAAYGEYSMTPEHTIEKLGAAILHETEA